jgi:hypothetical protein
MAHYRFNRHQLFTQEDRTEVLDLIREVEDTAYSNDSSRYEGVYGELTNMLFGLFDGYLYDNILTRAASIAVLPMDTIRRIEVIVDKCTQDILTNGQRVTLV